MKGYYWIASYPKSGNTWLRFFLTSYQRGGNKVDINRDNKLVTHCASIASFDHLLGLESSDLTREEIIAARPRLYELECARAEGPLYRKVHDACIQTLAGEFLFPLHVTLGAVCLVRDPRDVAVSFAHHRDKDLDNTIARMSRQPGKNVNPVGVAFQQLPQVYASWSDNVASWLAAPHRKLVLRYEDMVAAPLECFASVIQFLGWKFDPETLASAVTAVHFDELRQFELQHGFIERSNQKSHFFRQGRVGGWRECLTTVQVKRLEEEHGAVMQQLGYSLEG